MASDSDPLVTGKLTKKFLMELHEGLYLVSNIHHSPMKSIYAENVVSPNLREQQWRQIVETGANGRLCYVFRRKEDYCKYFSPLIAEMLIKDSQKRA